MHEWLIDKSALVRLALSPDAAKWLDRADRGLIHVSSLTLLEVGYSFRSADDAAHLWSEPPLARLLICYVTPNIEDRALEVQRLLTSRGQHRAPSVPDLMIAATAEKSGLTVLAIDKGFDLIAGITGQPIERLRIE